MSETNERDEVVSSQNSPAKLGVREPPRDFFGILRQLGPGLIIAGSIVGSGELIATTKTGAQAGISLLWLILIGCVIKVFVQIELGRYTVCTGETTLAALNHVPGPKLRVRWIVWYWLLMALIGLGQVGGIVGGVGQSLALAFPITGDYAQAIQVPSERELKRYIGWSDDLSSGRVEFDKLSESDQRRIQRGQEQLQSKLEALDQAEKTRGAAAIAAVRVLIAAERTGDDDEIQAAKSDVKALLEPGTRDDKYWALAVTLITIGILFRGRYLVIQNISTVLVVTFTFITIGNVVSLEFHPAFRLSVDEILSGLWFRLPEAAPAPPGIVNWEVKRPLATALATFGIIGVGASELVMYPYWCLEKGYAHFTGPRSDAASWAERARGWMRVMHYDALLSMFVYTVATLAFFMMGVAVMYKQGLDPEAMRMVSTLLEQYVPVFGEYARWLFLFGAIAVLYSTFLVANASFTRVYTDALKVFGLMDPQNQTAHNRAVAFFAVVLPFTSLSIYCTGADPVKLVLLGGTMQAIMLPMLAFAAIYFRFYRIDARLTPGRLWDVLLVVSCVGLLIAGAWGAYSKLA